MPLISNKTKEAIDEIHATVSEANHSSGAALKDTTVHDSIHSITRSAMRFFSGTMLSRISGMARDMILAFSFGTDAALAGLFVAFRLSHICRRLFGEGALQSAFVPLFEELRKASQNGAFQFFRDMTALWSVFLTLFILASMGCIAGARSLVSFSPGTDEILFFMIILMPSLLPICLFGLNASLLQCERRYFTVGIAPAFFNVMIAVTALWFHSSDSKSSMPYVAVSVVLGCVFQWLVTCLPALKITTNRLGKTDLLKNISFLSQDIKRLLGLLALGLVGIGASQINNAVDSIFAHIADPEGPAQLWFGLRLQQLPLALFGIAISSALLPPLSRAIQDENRVQYLHFLDFAIRRVLAFLMPCTAFLFVAGMATINAIYGRGDFQTHSIITTTGCLHGYALALVPMGLIMVLAPAFYARKNYTIPIIGALLSLGTNVVFDAFFVFVLGWKAVSVALATSLSSWINALYLYKKLTSEFGPVLSQSGKKSCALMLLAVAFAVCTTLTYLYWTSGLPILFNLFPDSASDLPNTFFSQIGSIFMPTSLFFGTLILVSFLVKIEDVMYIFRTK